MVLHHTEKAKCLMSEVTIYTINYIDDEMCRDLSDLAQQVIDYPLC